MSVATSLARCRMAGSGSAAGCGQSALPGLVFVYAVPPEFMTSLVPEYPALEQRLRGALRFSTVSYLNPVIDLDHLPEGAVAILGRIGHRLLDLFLAVDGDRLDAEIQRANIDVLAGEMGESQLESGTRRTFVKAVILMLNEQAREEERPLDDAAIRRLTGSADIAVPTFDDEEVFG